MSRWQLGVVAAFLVVYVATVFIFAPLWWLAPAAVFVLLYLGYAALHVWLRRRALARHGGDAQAASADHEDPIPSTADIPDDARPTGDTPEVHDEVNPHDFPLDSPVRRAAEAQARGLAGTTRGNRFGAAGGPAEGPAEDRTAERVGEEQRSAARAK